MGHELVAEFCRAHELRQDFFRRCQRVFRDEVQPRLDEWERLVPENADLKSENERLRTELTDARLKARRDKVPA